VLAVKYRGSDDFIAWEHYECYYVSKYMRDMTAIDAGARMKDVEIKPLNGVTT
jgi:hypothetical protein